MRALVVTAVFLLNGGVALAQSTAIDAQLYKPSLDGHGMFTVERSLVPGQWNFGMRLGSSYAQGGLSLDTLVDDGDEDILDHTLVLDVGFFFGVSDRLSFAMSAPILAQSLGSGFGTEGLYQEVDPSMARPGTGFYSTRPDQNLDPTDTPTGDVRVGAKYRLGAVDGKDGLALMAVAYVPYGDEDVFAGSRGFTIEPRVVWDVASGRSVFAVNVGARIREGTLARVRQTDIEGVVIDDADGAPVYIPLLYVGTEALLQVGFAHQVSDRIALTAEGTALYPILKSDECDDPCINGDPTAFLLGGIGWRLAADTKILVGAGAGVWPGAARREDFRAVASLAWGPTPEGSQSALGDGDVDGIPDGPDVCPDEPEDVDDFQDDDGCPELDNDLDGSLDAQDACPNEPEDRDGYEDADGCPEGDNDNDSVADLTDRCPGEAEDQDGFQDDDGCADDDNDGDAIADADDQCVNDPETVNQYLDEDGCPDQATQGGPVLANGRIDLRGDKVDFTTVTGVALTDTSQRLLDQVAQLLLANRNVRIRIEGYVEQRGTGPAARRREQELSQQRAQVVERYLLSKGVPTSQLDAVGFGSTRPIDPKNPQDARSNRRIDLIVVEQ